MKELSIEEKAKAYDEALTKARNIVNSINVGLIGKDSFEAVFPELKELEDEKINSDSLPKDNWELIHEFVNKFGRIPKDEDELNVLIEYVLRRQKPAWSEEDEMFVHGLIRGLAAKRDIHGHTTFSSDCIDITETINWLESLKNRVLLYPVSVEYNEDDIDIIADTFIPEPVWNALEESEGEGSNANAYDYSQMIAMFKAGVHWLKSLKDRVQLK